MSEQRRLAALVSADVAGYSRLMGRDESGTLTALKTLRREVVDRAIARHGGRIVSTTGHGLLIEFGSAVEALSARGRWLRTKQNGCSSRIRRQSAETRARPCRLAGIVPEPGTGASASKRRYI